MALTMVLFFVGLVLLVGGAELLVRGASSLAARVGISPLVVGLTVVAVGTSAPEMAVTLSAASAGGEQASLAIGNVVGSNIANVLLILGLAAIVVPLSVARQLVRLEVPLMIAVSVAVLGMSADGVLGSIDGLLLLVGGFAYLGFAVYQSRRETRAGADGAGAPEPSPGHTLRDLVLIGIGLVLLVFGARWLVDGAVAFATRLGVSELVIGLTVVAAGTSLPEIATSVVAAVRGMRDIAVGNAVGSNLLNLLLVLGAAAVTAPGGVPVPAQALAFDMPVMIAVALACLPVFYVGGEIKRWEGGLFLAYYLAYVVYLALEATGSIWVPTLVLLLVYFALPATVITYAALSARHLTRR